jgi:hypothetical protein|tara:strand:+ start:1716 stop:2018 length:303 start_codon:yes stop_codon:yes gene_type:complete
MSENREAKIISEDKPVEEKTNGLLTRDIHFSLEQANLAKDLLQAVNESRDVHIATQSKWEAFLIGVGMRSGDEIVGGDLDSDDPNERCLTIKTSNGIAGA